MCQFCRRVATAKYTCPRCNAPYCGKECYQSQGHRQCSEEFFKGCVQDAFRTEVKMDSKRKTLDALQRNFDDDDDKQVDLDSDDDEPLSERLAEIDLEDSDRVWQALTPEEQRDFLAQLQSGAIHDLVPPHPEADHDQMWWDIYWPASKIRPVDSQFPLHPKRPQIYVPEPLIDTQNSSPLIKHSILNCLCAYTFAYRHLKCYDKGSSCDKQSEFAAIVLAVSDNLRTGDNFMSTEAAIETATSKVAIFKSSCSVRPEMIRQDLLSIIRGPGEGHKDDTYVLAALSDLRRFLKKASQKKEARKIEFYICWILTNYDQYQPLIKRV